MFWFFAIPIILLVGGIIVIEVAILCYESIKEAVNKYVESYIQSHPEIKKEDLETFITKKLEEGDVPVINVGLRKRNGTPLEDMRVKPTQNVDANDYSVGQRIPLTC